MKNLIPNWMTRVLLLAPAAFLASPALAQEDPSRARFEQMRARLGSESATRANDVDERIGAEEARKRFGKLVRERDNLVLREIALQAELDRHVLDAPHPRTMADYESTLAERIRVEQSIRRMESIWALVAPPAPKPTRPGAELAPVFEEAEQVLRRSRRRAVAELVEVVRAERSVPHPDRIAPGGSDLVEWSRRRAENVRRPSGRSRPPEPAAPGRENSRARGVLDRVESEAARIARGDG